MHYVLFCMPEISPCKLYLLRKGTDPNRYSCVFAEVCMWSCHSSEFVIVVLFSCLRRHVPNSVLSIDLSQHLDSADDNSAAAQWVSHVAVSNRHKYKVSVLTKQVPSFPRPNYSYSCLDARFYDDEMLTVVLQGLEKESRRHVLAQVPLASTLSCDTEFNWEPNLRCVCACVRSLQLSVKRFI